ncbi:MAG TPA: GPR1/FUN34/YaaH family transporter, partial [Candidatus Acidoferrales bacterium]|nr:GPR1/FUN34/YaaH family transporter [Candidatus Acidoferrales bacterium]
AFWWAIFFLLFVQPKMGLAAGPHEALGFFLMWTLFTLSFCLAVHRVGKFLAVLFWLLFIAFVLLDCVFAGYITAPTAGWEILLTGLVAWYIATATLVNTVSGKKVLPLS